MDRNLTELAIRDQSFQYSEDDFWAGLLVSVECIIGFVMLAFVILGCTRIPTLKSPFGMLMVNQNVTQLVACANSGLDFNIRVAIMAHWFGSFFICVWVFGFRECTFIFYHYGWIFTSAPYSEKCGSIVKTYNMYVQLVLSTAIFAFDIATILVLVFLRNRVYSKQSTAVRRREMSFAAQVMIQGLVFFMMGLWYDKGHAWIPGNDQRWKTFFTSSFSVNLMHVFDPLVVFVFNPEFRKWIFRGCVPTFIKQHNNAVSTFAT
uniref:7TM_GPCR_Srx domain-containing protein n=1 Tax=Caenorhabditis tropicalis TaxID=1561998 RepID=A0A1I7TUH6_9PELO